MADGSSSDLKNGALERVEGCSEGCIFREQLFSLKMQLFYLNKKIEGRTPEEDDASTSIVEDRSADILILREENEHLRRQAVDLESEILQLQLMRENDAVEYQTALQEQPAHNFALMEESRKREREVAKAIAEHDAALILKMQVECESLQYQSADDQRLVDDCTIRVAELMEALGAKDAHIESQNVRVADLERTVTLLGAASHRQEVLYSDLSDSKQASALLREENSSLRVQLELQSSAVLSQAQTLREIQMATSEMGLLESEESARLGAELDKSLDEKEKLLQRCQKLEISNAAVVLQLSESREGSGGNGGMRTPGGDKTLEYYQNREAEMVYALEGVVRRCQELELQNQQKGRR